MSLDLLTDYAGGLLRQLDAGSRRKLASQIARDLRASQQKRITEQRNPDGSDFAPRKTQARDKKGRIKRLAMFRKLRTARFLKTSATASEAAIKITGRAGRIAAVHQQGLRDRVRPGGPEVAYTRRQLLGFADADVAALENTILAHLSV